MLPPEESTPYIDRIERLTDKVEMIMDAAIRRADDRLAIMASRELARNLELFGKASGELYRDTALGSQVPMFVLPRNAVINVHPTLNVLDRTTTGSHENDQPMKRIVIPEENPPETLLP